MFGKIGQKISKTVTAVLIALIKAYQWLISPLMGQRCRFYPSCSQYTLQALTELGVVRGGLLSAKRLLKCHPFNPGGIDPVPEKQSRE